jgi:hypothetical protein
MDFVMCFSSTFYVLERATIGIGLTHIQYERGIDRDFVPDANLPI